MIYDMEFLRLRCDEMGLNMTDNEFVKLFTYYDLLIERNEQINLTKITEFHDVVEKHFLDSLILNNVIDLTTVESVMDVGTGAGFPGIPLKIAFPNLYVVLNDSMNKKVKFLQEVIDKLELDGIEAIHGRAEDMGQSLEYRERFDLCVSRAVANLSSLSEYCLPFVKEGGTFIAYKSGTVEEEVEAASSAIKKLGGSKPEIVYFKIPDTDIERSFVIIKKKKKTPNRYPRKAGTPSKQPLM